MNRGRELLNQGNTDFVRNVDLTGDIQDPWLDLGRKAIDCKKLALLKLQKDVEEDWVYGADLDWEFVGEDNAGLDALGIIGREIQQCEEILTECGNKDFGPLLAYAQREMERQAEIFDQAVDDERHAARMEHPNWRVLQELGATQHEALEQLVFWRRVTGVDQEVMVMVGVDS